MGYSVLQNFSAPASNEPDWEAGAKFIARSLNAKKRPDDPPRRYIMMTIGRKLAGGLSLTKDSHRVRIMFGDGDEHGNIAVTVDNESGEFVAKKNAQNRYNVSFGKSSAEGKMLTEFAPYFACKGEIIKIDPQKPVFGVLNCKPIVV